MKENGGKTFAVPLQQLCDRPVSVQLWFSALLKWRLAHVALETEHVLPLFIQCI